MPHRLAVTGLTVFQLELTSLTSVTGITICICYDPGELGLAQKPDGRHFFWSNLVPFVKLHYFLKMILAHLCPSTRNFSLIFYFQTVLAVECESPPVCAPGARE